MFLLTLFSTLQNSKIFKYKSIFCCCNVYRKLSLISPWLSNINQKCQLYLKIRKVKPFRTIHIQGGVFNVDLIHV